MKWTYFYLYVIIDIFSRYVVGWLVASRENSDLAVHLISETCCYRASRLRRSCARLLRFGNGGRVLDPEISLYS